jgi:hypothetical protein
VERKDAEGRTYRRRHLNVADRWLRFVGCVSRHPVTPILGLLLGLQNLTLGLIYLFGVIDDPNLTLLSRLLDAEERGLWIWIWGIGLTAAGVSQVYGVVRERWWCVVAGSNLALACMTFASTVYALNFSQAWVALISPALFALALNGYLMILASIESLKHPHQRDRSHFSHHRDEEQKEEGTD